MANYNAIFASSLLINIAITFRSSGLYQRYKHCFLGSTSRPSGVPSEEAISFLQDDNLISNKSKHRNLMMRYLPVYLLATLSDWLQGPYVYALYDSYGYSQHDIAVLFVAGFGSSMIFGSFIGGMADASGRRKFVVLFTLIYASSCLTKHVKSFNVLLLGRLLGGIATSLLFSVFDSWLIRAHSIAKIDKAFLSQSFSWAFYGNSIVAIIAGLIANKIANYNPMTPLANHPDSLVHIGGYINPFDFALLALILCGTAALFLWEENYGETAQPTDESQQVFTKTPTSWVSSIPCLDAMKKAYVTTMRNKDILLCGVISSFFEGSMYIFVFMWTPALTSLTPKSSSQEGEEIHLPFGLIFSTFMVNCMAGSSLFSLLIQKYRAELLSIYIFFVSSFSFLVISLSSSDFVTFVFMNLFEICVGMYFPSMGTMKSSIVPETQRSAIYNLYRIPLNFIVLTSLLTSLTPVQSFAVCCGMLCVACALQVDLTRRRVISSPNGTNGTSERQECVEEGGGGCVGEDGSDKVGLLSVEGNEEMKETPLSAA